MGENNSEIERPFREGEFQKFEWRLIPTLNADYKNRNKHTSPW